MEHLEQWRESVRRWILIAIVPLALLMALLLGIGWPLPLSLPTRIVLGSFLGAICAAAVFPRLSSRTRAAMVIAICLAMGFAQLARGGLASDGRITLTTLPVFALVTLGIRAGWICMGGSMAVYILAIGLHGTPWWQRIGDNAASLHSVDGWATIGIAMALHASTAMLLVTLLVRKQLGLVAVAQDTASRLRLEAAEREKAGRALDHESRERRRLQEELLRAGLEDRQLVAAELHDGLCQQLTAAMLRVAAAESVAEPATAGDLAASRRILSSCIDDAYVLMDRLAPLEMAPDSLPQLLEQLAEQTRQCAGIHCVAEIVGSPGELEPMAVLHLCRIAQEAVRNALRHARAGSICISVAVHEGSMILSVSDNGVGIADGREAGRGMKSMQYRAQRLGAMLQVQMRDGGGTQLTCTCRLDSVRLRACHADGTCHQNPIPET